MNSSSCPRQFNCTNLTSFDIGTIPTYASIVSSSLSCVGSLLILFAYWTLREMRTIAQKIITLLAIADLLTAIGYLMAAWNFLSHFNVDNNDDCEIFQTVCKAQSFITTWSTLCSFGWTVSLALHFYLIVRYFRQELVSKIFLFENLTVWLFPTLIVVTLLATQKLGYTRYATSNWCYVTDTGFPSSDLRDSGVTVVLMLIAGNLWEILSYIAVGVLYSLTRRQFSVNARARDGSGQAGVEKRLLLIPLVFILLRAWGTIQFFFSLATSDLNQEGCIPSWVQKVYLTLGILQAIGDGGQGWGNALLYVFLSSTIRQELFCSLYLRSVFCKGKSDSDASVHIHSTSAVNITWKDRKEQENNPLSKRNTNYGATHSSSKLLLSSSKLSHDESKA